MAFHSYDLIHSDFFDEALMILHRKWYQLMRPLYFQNESQFTARIKQTSVEGLLFQNK
jgi:hypothetical protein